MMSLVYYAIAAPLFAAFGLLSHLARGLFNVYPDRDFTSSPRNRYSAVDDILSGNYSLTDHLVGTEYDENGYYDLHSLKNLRIACTFSIGSGMIALLVVPDLPPLFQQAVDFGLVWLKDLFFYRIANIEIF